MASAEGRGDLNILVIGKTGNGKSAICNSLLERAEFEEGEGGMSETTECRMSTGSTNGRFLRVIDTPGTMDVFDQEAAMENLKSALDEWPEGIDAFLLVFRYDTRMTAEELEAADKAISAFGAKAAKRAIAVFTHCEKYNDDKDGFLRHISRLCKNIPEFDKLMSKIGKRVIMLDNRKDCDPEVRQQQLKDLLELADEVAKHNGLRFKKEDQESESEAKNQLALISTQMQRIGELQMAQVQQLQQVMMVKMMLDMHAREFGTKMEVERMKMRESLQDELRLHRLQMQVQQRSSDCSIL